MDIDAYMRRIDYHGPLDPTSRTLRALHAAHMLAVPFENLSIHLGQPIVIEVAALFEKIVVRRRGGFCYELNGLFAALLRELGFDVTLLSAGVVREDGSLGPEFDHMALLVYAPGDQGQGDKETRRQRDRETEDRRSKIEDGGSRMNDPPSSILHPQEAPDLRFLIPDPRSPIPAPGGWLADVGFGDAFRQPLRLDDPGAQLQDGQAYRLAREGERWTMLQCEDGATWEPQYTFTLQPRQYADFAGMCHYHQTSPESSFTRRRICSLATPEGRITLSDTRLIITTRGERQERPLAGEAEYAAALREYFGIDLGEAGV